MASSEMPPGRPGNLTAEQEARLKEMWIATLDVFGVRSEERENGSSTPDSKASAEQKKKRKSRLSLFGKKSKDKDTNGVAGDSSDNDKHGQMKGYHDALASTTPEQLRAAFWSMAKHDHPDALLLRFLRARKWDVQAALVMLVAAMHWRSATLHVDDDIMLRGEGAALQDSTSDDAAQRKEGADFMAQLRMGKSFLHGTDADGRPCCYVRARLHKPGEQSEKSLERFTVYTIETARMLLRPPVDTATIVFDMTGFSLANMDYTPVKFMIQCFEANYPESLGSVLVYHAPFVFKTIWAIVKNWLDPVVAAKVHFCTDIDALSRFIPRERITRELGGMEEYAYAYVEPREGEDDRMLDGERRDAVLTLRRRLVEEFERLTMGWLDDEEGGGERRVELAAQLAANYWELDPYVRARSLYDRVGVLRPGGGVDSGAAAAAAPVGGGPQGTRGDVD